MHRSKTLSTALLLVLLGGAAAAVQTALYVRAHGCLEYSLYRLAAQTLTAAVNQWLLISLMAGIVLLLARGLGMLLSGVVTVGVRNTRKARIIGTIVLLGCAGLACWALNDFVFARAQEHIRIRWRLVLNCALAAGIFLPGMLVIWRAWRPAIPASMQRPIVATGVLYCVFIALCNCAMFFDRSVSGAQKPNVVCIVVDCLRARDVGYWGSAAGLTPAIDSLAKRSVVFTKAYTNAPWTKPAVASLFTSQLPGTHRAIGFFDKLQSRVVTLAEVLKNNGYHTCFFHGGNYNFARPFNLPQGFDHLCDSLERKNAAVVTDEFITHIEQQPGQPFFAYIHYMDAHQPYKPNPYTDTCAPGENTLFDPSAETTDAENMIFFDIVRKLHRAGKLSPDDQRYLKGLYDSEVRFIDENIQRVLSFLKSAHLDDTTFVIVTADHGEEFWEHNNYEHGHSLYNELLHVPLIVAGTKLTYKEIPGPVQLIDVMPTVLDLLHIDAPAECCRGVSLGGTIVSNAPVPEVPVRASGTLYGDEKFCLIRNNKKVIFNTGYTKDKGALFGQSDGKQFEFYDLAADPLEQVCRSDTNDDEFSAMKDELMQSSLAVLPEAGGKAVVDEALKNKLKTLGYMQ